MTGSANVNVSRDKMHSTWQSVAEQTGIFAGKGGVDVTVGEHTQLNGAVIASTADASLNKLDTGTLGFGDIENHADYKVEHQSAGMSTGGGIGGQFAGNMANGMLAGLNGSGSASSVTKSAVSEGTIVIRDKEKQAQDVADLSRDVANANPGLDVIFDKEREQNRLKAAQLIGEIGAQAGDIARTQGQIAGMKAQQDPAALNAAREQLAASGRPYTESDVTQRAYDNAMKPFGTGSSLQQGISAVTAAVQGLSGGNLAQAVSGAAAPYLAEKIHALTTDANGKVNVQANLMAHAVLGAVTSYAAGNTALAGASGAVMGEYIAQQLYPGVKRSDLSEEQRQTISALGTLAAGLAGGVAGDSTADVVAGAQGGKNALENNNLILPRPVPLPVPGLPLSPGDKVIQDANRKIASELDNALKGSGTEADMPPINDGPSIVEARDEAANSRDPYVAKELTDAEKAELGGAGSGTPGGWEPQDEENARNNESNKPSQNGGNFTGSEIDDRIASANKPINNQGMSAAARAWEKHAGRPGGTFEPLKGNQAQKNAAAENFIRDLLNDPSTVRNELSRGGVEYRASNGQGVRFNPDGSFNTLLDPPVKK